MSTAIRPVDGVLLLLLAATTAGCNTLERLSQVGRVPELAPIENPVERPEWKPVRMPMPAPEPEIAAGANSLWRSGARGFFRDQRARRVGDILTVEVTISDRAKLSNETTRKRDNSDGLGIADLLGLENKLQKVLPSSDGRPLDPASLVDLESSMANRGSGKVDRAETVRLQIAAVIVQQLPNGNLVIEGRQEVRVNYEIREIYVAGVVRPEDISPRNTIAHDKIAELRVGYGGRGQLTDVQQPRYGAQILDILLPY
ncbi:Flagellar L-ring protein [bacterium HR40]|nr:Flagellar L-ring protein [bacterium HR40]